MTPCPASDLEKLSFLAGHWRGESNIGVIEEMWLAPAGGVAQGTVRVHRGDDVHTIELIVASAESDRVVMRFNHFNRDLSTWERTGPITLTLTEAAAKQIIFTNLEAVQRHAAEAGYRATSANQMTSWIIAIDQNGARTRHSFDYQRVQT